MEKKPSNVFIKIVMMLLFLDVALLIIVNGSEYPEILYRVFTILYLIAAAIDIWRNLFGKPDKKQ